MSPALGATNPLYIDVQQLKYLDKYLNRAYTFLLIIRGIHVFPQSGVLNSFLFSASHIVLYSPKIQGNDQNLVKTAKNYRPVVRTNGAGTFFDHVIIRGKNFF